MKDQIIKGMSLAFFASAYADQAKECGKTLRGEIMDQLPGVIDPAAWIAANTLALDMQNTNAKRPGWTLTGCYLFAKQLQKFNNDKGDRELTPELFGHYCAMQAMGHGVGLDSFGQAVYDAIQVPYIEFGSHSLEKDYFTTDEGDK